MKKKPLAQFALVGLLGGLCLAHDPVFAKSLLSEKGRYRSANSYCGGFSFPAKQKKACNKSTSQYYREKLAAQKNEQSLRQRGEEDSGQEVFAQASLSEKENGRFSYSSKQKEDGNKNSSQSHRKKLAAKKKEKQNSLQEDEEQGIFESSEVFGSEGVFELREIFEPYEIFEFNEADE